ncbi:MAG TPA: GNAT family N-acetyltransferase [Rhizomicrobium sp.]|nr:GNAT family N-acetyltransferase [Rhizomicrobium sp.]
MTQIRLSLAPLEDCAALEGEWRALEQRADIDFYMSWGWIGTLLRRSGLTPFVVRAHDGARLIGLGLVFTNRQRRHRWLGVRKLYLNETGDLDIDILFIEHNGFLCDSAYGAALPARCIDYVLSSDEARALLGRWDEWRFGGVGEEYKTLLAATGLHTHVYSARAGGVVELDALRARGETYLSTLSSNTRYQIRRALKLYGERGPLTVTPAITEADFARHFEGLKSLHQSYWLARGQKGAFGYPFLHDFHREVLLRHGPLGEVELLRIAAGDFEIGYLYNFTFGGKVGAYLSGFAYEDDAKLKPGLVSHYLAIEHHLAGAAHVYDLLAGDMQYKRSLAMHSPQLYWLDLQRPRLKLRLEDVARGLKHRFQAARTPDAKTAPEGAVDAG